MENEEMKYFELAIKFFDSLPDELKMQECDKVECEPRRLLNTINVYAEEIKALFKLLK